jgi:TRAP-type C4-dicarboxylate transport system permease small subunit
MATEERENPKGAVGILFSIDDLVGGVLRQLTVAAFLFMLAMMAVQVLTRFVLHVSMPWSEELTRYVWVTICFVASGLAVKYDEHIEIDIISSVLKRIGRTASRRRAELFAELFRYAVVLAVSVYAAYICMDFIARELAAMTQLTPALRLPKWWIDLVICSGWLIAAFHSALKIVRAVVAWASASRTPKEGGAAAC